MSLRRNPWLDILEPRGNRWLQELMGAATPLPAGVRIVRHEEGESAVFESGVIFRLPRKAPDCSI